MSEVDNAFASFEHGRPAAGQAAPHPWRPLAELVSSPRPLAVRAERARVRLRTQHRVAVSVVLQGVVTRLVSPPVAAAARGRLLVLDPHTTWWQDTPDNPFPLMAPPGAGTEPLAGDADAIAAVLAETLLEPLVRPLLDSARALARLAPTLLGGNAASAVLGAAQAVGTPSADRLAVALLRLPLLASTGDLVPAGPTGTGLAFHRRTCCLLLRVPGTGPCPDCPVLWRTRPDHGAQGPHAVSGTSAGRTGG